MPVNATLLALEAGLPTGGRWSAERLFVCGVCLPQFIDNGWGKHLHGDVSSHFSLRAHLKWMSVIGRCIFHSFQHNYLGEIFGGDLSRAIKGCQQLHGKGLVYFCDNRDT